MRPPLFDPTLPTTSSHGPSNPSGPSNFRSSCSISAQAASLCVVQPGEHLVQRAERFPKRTHSAAEAMREAQG